MIVRMLTACAAVSWLLITPFASAINIEVEFLGSTFFSENPTARTAIEAAADHVGDALTSTLAPIDQNTFTASVGTTDATLDFGHAFIDEQTNQPIGNFPTSVQPSNLAVDTVRVFIDAQLLEGDTVGTGVPAGAEASIRFRFFEPFNPAAGANVAAQADAEMNRGGGGPLVGVLDGLGGAEGQAIRFRASFGGVAFDTDTDNNNVVDTEQQMLDFWHLDPTLPVESGKIDLFSVAVSEIVASLGFGASDSFLDQSDGSDWLGEEAIALLGTGQNVLDTNESGHIREGTLSTRVSGGSIQSVALDPVIAAGVREELTSLDLAFLRDIGWQTLPAGQAGDFNIDGSVNAADYTVWRDGLGTTFSLADYEVWASNFGASVAAAPAVNPVPEPSAGLLVLMLITTTTCLRRSSERCQTDC